MRTIDALALAVIVGALGLGSCVDCLGQRAEGQDRPVSARLAAGGRPRRAPEPADVVLARALVAEVDGNAADLRPILAVFQARADRVGSSPAALAVLYCSIYRVTPRALSPAEVLELAGALGPTSGYSARVRGIFNRARQIEIAAMPGAMSDRRRVQWDRSIAVVRAWLAGERSSGCSSTPSHFGDRRADAARALRMGWRVVECPGALSGFWSER